MAIYRAEREPLHKLLDEARSGEGATLLIPDLQRPYVWAPSQVTRLVDSLLRGWPFGTLLLWSVQANDLTAVPSRPFWRVVDRTERVHDDLIDRVKKGNPPAQFRMVLDGQQRLQSLLLAFGGDNWGFRLLDREWSEDQRSAKPKGRKARQHWSLGQLCIDLEEFRTRARAAGGLVGVDFSESEVLKWAIVNPTDGISKAIRPHNYEYPLEMTTHVDSTRGLSGRLIPLSRLWDDKVTPPRADLKERHFRENLVPLLKQYEVPGDLTTDVLDWLAEMLSTMRDVKLSEVSYLQLQPYAEGLSSRDQYNDAIVNIFTRLNSAGRTLTHEEITFAWIKSGWDHTKTGNKNAGEAFEELRKTLAADHIGVGLQMDGLVGAVSVMWSILHRKGELLTNKDLLVGEKVRPMAQDLTADWQVLSQNAKEGLQIVAERNLRYGEHYRSLNVLILLLAWRLLARQWLAAHPLGVTDKDSFEKSVDELFADASDRWIVLSHWSGRWGKSTDIALAEYAKNLAADWEALQKAKGLDEVLGILSVRMNGWLDALRPESVKYIMDLAVLTREAVHQYFLPLWIWHRIDSARWQASMIVLREGGRKRTDKYEVDHTVAVGLWEDLVGNQSANGEESDQAPSADAEDLSTVMNSLGNCCLLEKTFNISKGKEPLSVFLERVHEFRKKDLGKTPALEIDQWASDLGMNGFFLSPTREKLAELQAAVIYRTQQMKAGLIAYINGTTHRADLDENGTPAE